LTVVCTGYFPLVGNIFACWAKNLPGVPSSLAQNWQYGSWINPAMVKDIFRISTVLSVKYKFQERWFWTKAAEY